MNKVERKRSEKDQDSRFYLGWGCGSSNNNNNKVYDNSHISSQQHLPYCIRCHLRAVIHIALSHISYDIMHLLFIVQAVVV